MSTKTKSPPVQRTPASLQGDSFEPTITRSLTWDGGKCKMWIKSGVWEWLSFSCLCVGGLTMMGCEGNMQVGAPFNGRACAAGIVLLVLALVFQRLAITAKEREERCRKVHRAQRNTVKKPGSRKAGRSA